MSGSLAIIIPVRSLSGGKTRLGPETGPELRAAMTAKMLRSVLAAATGSGVANAVLLVSPDPDALAVAGEFGSEVTPVEQPAERRGLNPAIDLGREVALTRSVDRMLMLFADLPLLRPEDVRTIAAETAPVVVATDRAGMGTNGLLLDLSGPARAFVFHFGEGSAELHRREAERLGLEVAELRTPGTTFDLDTPADLRDLLEIAGDNPDLMSFFPEAAR
jgi:2-phospho-L-lactate guanylyltransferase